MANGTLENLSKSSFVRTPPWLGARIYRHLLSFPSSSASPDDSAIPQRPWSAASRAWASRLVLIVRSPHGRSCVI